VPFNYPSPKSVTLPVLSSSATGPVLVGTVPGAAEFVAGALVGVGVATLVCLDGLSLLRPVVGVEALLFGAAAGPAFG
jgi:hypothetical protein